MGLLKSLLENGEIPTTVVHANLSFVETLAIAVESPQLALSAYESIATTWSGLTEWIFSPNSEFGCPAIPDNVPKELVQLAKHHSQQFVAEIVDRVLQSNSSVVGITTTMNQCRPALAIAQALKAARPSLRIVLGGASCEGEMGEELIRACDFVDAVVQGEAEEVAVPLFKQLLAGGTGSHLSGVLTREAPFASGTDQVDFRSSPLPNYDEYYRHLHTTALAGEPSCGELVYESARGCWWGQRHHCTFCGLNGESMAFRSKPANLVLNELTRLSTKYRRTDFFVVDNIIDMDHVRELMPLLSATETDYRLFYETKANLTWKQLRSMHNAGVRSIQPGIESLSTPVLRLMRKGVSALQNIRLLKWCRFLGIEVGWSIIHGFPREPASEYKKMASLARSLVHLPPPIGVHRLRLDRFSPYFERAEHFGIRITGPSSFYGPAYAPLGIDPNRIAYFFEYEYAHPQPVHEHVATLENAVVKWQRAHQNSTPRLQYQRGPDFIRITDSRTEDCHHVYTLDELEAAIYEACQDGATVPQVRRTLFRRGFDWPGKAETLDFLVELADQGLVYREDQRFLSLAIPETRTHRPYEDPVLKTVPH